MRNAVMVSVLAVLTVFGALLTGCGNEGGDLAGRPLVIGAADTPVMRVMGEIYAGVLRRAGTAVSSEITLGDDPAQLAALDTAEVDLFPAFTGRLLSRLAPALPPTTPDDVYNDLNRSLPQGVSVGDRTPVSDVPTLYVNAAAAGAAGVTDLSGCSRLPAGLPVVVVGAPAEITVRAFAGAGCRLGAVEQVADAAQVRERVAAGGANGILSPLQDALASASAGAGGDVDTRLRRLSGGHATTPGPRAEDLVPVYRSAALRRDQVKIVNTIAGEISTADLGGLARRAAAGENTRTLATDWLTQHGF
ncbi:MAG: glycine betaine ABC transporter substrate-binding protein [Gordonia sp. (in: high G+C Gram-positive bacteria)]